MTQLKSTSPSCPVRTRIRPGATGLVFGCWAAASLLAACGQPLPVEVLDPPGLAALLAAQAGQRSLLLLYLTTCPHCRDQIEILNDLPAANPDLVILGIALDDDEDAVGRYVGSHAVPFPARQLKPWDYYGLATNLALHGVLLPGELRVPFMAVLGPDAQAVAQFMGTTGRDALQASLDAASD